jgi:hypothetical protein
LTLCLTCKNRQKCTKLCEEAEAYVNQDHVKMRDFPCEVEKMSNTESGTVWDMMSERRESKTEIAVRVIFTSLPPQRQLAEISGVDQAHISRLIQKMRKAVL